MRASVFGIVTILFSLSVFAQNSGVAIPDESEKIMSFCRQLFHPALCLQADTLDHATTCDEVTSLTGPLEDCLEIAKKRNLSHDSIVFCGGQVTRGAFDSCLSIINSNYHFLK